MSETIKVICKMDFAKNGVGENAHGFKGQIIEVSPKLAEFLADKNIVDVILDEDEPKKEEKHGNRRRTKNRIRRNDI